MDVISDSVELYGLWRDLNCAVSVNVVSTLTLEDQLPAGGACLVSVSLPNLEKKTPSLLLLLVQNILIWIFQKSTAVCLRSSTSSQNLAWTGIGDCHVCILCFFIFRVALQWIVGCHFSNATGAFINCIYLLPVVQKILQSVLVCTESDNKSHSSDDLDAFSQHFLMLPLKIYVYIHESI